MSQEDAVSAGFLLGEGEAGLQSLRYYSVKYFFLFDTITLLQKTVSLRQQPYQLTTCISS